MINVDIKIEWTDRGARILTTLPIECMVCGAQVEPKQLHECGEMVTKPAPVKKPRKPRPPRKGVKPWGP